MIGFGIVLLIAAALSDIWETYLEHMEIIQPNRIRSLTIILFAGIGFGFIVITAI